MESNNVIDFAIEKAKRTKLKDLHFPNEGPIPLNEKMMNAVNEVDKAEWKASYHQEALEEETPKDATDGE